MLQTIVDSHIHLWPASTANPEGHIWMEHVPQLAKQYSINDYVGAKGIESKDYHVAGFVFIETDPAVDDQVTGDVRQWAAEPLKEIAFLRRIVEGQIENDEGFDASHADLMRGIVAWAPLNRDLPDFLAYMQAIKEAAGEKTWSKIKGFRYLVQGIHDQGEFNRLMDPATSSFGMLLKFLGARGLSFDVGVDQHRAGMWQLEKFTDMIEFVHKDVPSKDKTVFIMNHLCKPDMELAFFNEASSATFRHWKAVISRMAAQEKVYMKLSGLFSEVAQGNARSNYFDQLVENMQPWIDHIFKEFGPWRIMFGSDWPVCNVGGPGDAESWSLWVDVVAEAMRKLNLSEMEMNAVWYGTATEAYKLGPIR